MTAAQTTTLSPPPTTLRGGIAQEGAKVSTREASSALSGQENVDTGGSITTPCDRIDFGYGHEHPNKFTATKDSPRVSKEPGQQTTGVPQ